MSDKKIKQNEAKRDATTLKKINTHRNESNPQHRFVGFMIADQKAPQYTRTVKTSGQKSKEEIFVAPPMGRKK